MLTIPTDAILAATLRAIGDGVISCDRDGRVNMMNGVAAELTGWSEQEALGRPLKDVFVILNETTRKPVEDPVHKVLRLGTVVDLSKHTVLARRDGTEVAVDDSAAPILDERGELRGVVLVFRDVTARREAEWNLELLSRSGTVLGEAVLADDLLARMDGLLTEHFADLAVFDLIQPSGELQRRVGRHRLSELQDTADELCRFILASELSADPTWAVLESRASIFLPVVTDAIMQAAARDAEHLEFLRTRLKPRSILAVPVCAGQRHLGVLTFIRNVMALPFTRADQIAGEELGARVGAALTRTVEELANKDILTNTRDRVTVIDQNALIVSINIEGAKRLGFSDIGSFVGRSWLSYWEGQHQAEAERALTEARVTGAGHFEGELQFADEATWWDVTITAMQSSRRFLVVSREITSRRLVELALRRSEERFRTLIDRASVGINIGDANGALTYMNPALLSLIGYTEEEVRRGEVRWDDLTPPKYAEVDRSALRQLQEAGVAQPYEKAYRAKDGRLVPMLLGATMIPASDVNSEGDDIAVFFTDLTRQKRAEAALLQTEKLAAVGKLASTISHEINNPLEAVTNLLFIVRQDPTVPQHVRDYLETADRELARVSQVTSQTLRFHRQSTAATMVKADALVGEVLQLYSARLANSEIEIRRDYASDALLTCFEGDVRQVLNNLVGNAVDAMRVGGRLTVRTRRATRWSTKEHGVRITIADSGAGMSREVLAQIFEAFFTTKGINGTGLGLWISCRIVHKHRGYVRAYSSPSPNHHGSVFELWLPLQLADTAKEPWHVEAGDAV